MMGIEIDRVKVEEKYRVKEEIEIFLRYH